jgi:DNA-binding transcriptional ArsR family regulator
VTQNSQDIRQISDSLVLAAMAHPLRRRLIDALNVDGPSTATMLAQRTEQAVGNVSHHLRVLAVAELIEEAPELARDRRERWWRLVAGSLRWSTTDFKESLASEAVASAAESLSLDHHVGLVRHWQAASDAEREAWGDSPFSSSKWLRLTPEELAEFGRQVLELLDVWASRETPDDGQRRDPVFTFAFGVPAQP